MSIHRISLVRAADAVLLTVAAAAAAADDNDADAAVLRRCITLFRVTFFARGASSCLQKITTTQYTVYITHLSYNGRNINSPVYFRDQVAESSSVSSLVSSPTDAAVYLPLRPRGVEGLRREKE